MTTIFDHFARGMQVGSALRDRARERQQQERYGSAFDNGGWGAVAKEAGSMGDLETVGAIQEQQSQQEETTLARAQRNATVLSNAATSLMGLPYEQRAARVQQMAPMLEQMGLDPQQIASFDPTDEALASIRAIQGQFSQYTDIREQGDDIVGIRPDGSVQVLRQGRPAASSGYQWSADGTRQQYIPGGPEDPANRGARGGGSQYRMLDPGEVEQLGLPPGSYQQNTETGQVTVVGRTRGQYTEGASSAAQYASRMSAAHDTLVELENSGVDRTGVYVARFTGGSEDERRIRQAQREFLNAILRRESGAVINPDEFASGQMQYFPVPGDSPRVIEQKRQARQRSIQGLINASQGAYDEWYGEGSGAERPPPPPPPGETMGGIVGGIGLGAAEGAGQTQQFTPGEVYEDAAGNAARFNADGTWTPVD